MGDVGGITVFAGAAGAAGAAGFAVVVEEAGAEAEAAAGAEGGMARS
ncbi:hypothetical protein [Streptomyces physcomitrii]|uniref:PE family protein n=1 Tax=Streptomyces physcomitrii TaxID=2724184 RepID=A0ABX1H7S1_9ACTN|nr:hypothetical protein [Streptomyces physcomitrii]NKI43294.1 hypothetical protein [Streptomyces physcomitrii]